MNLSVIIPVYNEVQNIREILKRVQATGLPWEILIVDDGSTDGTADASSEFLEQVRPPFEWKIVRCKHGSAAYARQAGYELIRQLPYVAFLDSDDHWPNDFLQRGVAALTNDLDAVAAHPAGLHRRVARDCWCYGHRARLPPQAFSHAALAAAE